MYRFILMQCEGKDNGIGYVRGLWIDGNLFFRVLIMDSIEAKPSF